MCDPDINRIIAVEEPCNLLHGRVPCFHDAEVDDADLESEENTIADVVLPCECLERNTIHELIEEKSSCNAEVEPRETLGTQTIRQDFGGIAGHDT